MLELDYVLMVHFLKQIGLLLEEFNTFLVQCFSFDDFDCNLFICLLVNGVIYCAEWALTQDTLKLIVLWVRLALLKFEKIARNLLIMEHCLLADNLFIFPYAGWHIRTFLNHGRRSLLWRTYWIILGSCYTFLQLKFIEVILHAINHGVLCSTDHA